MPVVESASGLAGFNLRHVPVGENQATGILLFDK
jgi:hypothetical protein